MRGYTLFFTSLLFTVSSLHAGLVLRLSYDGINGDKVAALRAHSSFPNRPARVEVLTNGLVSAQNTADNYGSLIRGFFEAPQTGDYLFWVAGDDETELWLSTDYTAANLRPAPIAKVSSYVNPQSWTDNAEQQSVLIPLVAEQTYYFEVIHKDGVGGDHVAVGWMLPDGTVERPIPQRYLSPLPVKQDPALPPSVSSDFSPRENVFPTIIQGLYHGVVINGQPELLTVTEGSSATFTMNYEGSHPMRIHWHYLDYLSPKPERLARTPPRVPFADKEFNPVPYRAYYHIPAVTSAQNGMGFTADMENGVIGGNNNSDDYLQSGPGILVVLADTNAPTLVWARTFGNTNGVDIRFSENVSKATAENKNNYTVSQGVTVASAFLVDSRTVRLTTSPIPEGKLYQVTVRGVQDRAQAPNTIADPSVLTFLQVQSVLEMRSYNNMTGDFIADLTNHVRFAEGAYDEQSYQNIFEFPPIDEGSMRNDYGVHFRGYITAPVEGDYIFAVSADNQAIVWLSPDTNPENKQLLVAEPVYGWRRTYIDAGTQQPSRIDPTFTSGGPANISTSYRTIRLNAGGKYYIEALNKEGGGGNHIALAWQKPGDAAMANGTVPIGPEYLSSLAKNGPVTIKRDLEDVLVESGQSVSFTVEVEGAPPYQYQWFKNSEPLTGETKPQLFLTRVDSSDENDRYSVEVRNRFSSVTSRAVPIQIKQAEVLLTIDNLNGVLTVQWTVGGWTLQESSDLNSPQNWTDIPGTEQVLSHPVAPGPLKFYRLIQRQ